MSVYSRLYRSGIINEQITPDAWGTYGISQLLGEWLCRSAAEQYPDATIIALRMFAPRNEVDWQALNAKVAAKGSRHLCFNQGPDDMRRLYLADLDCRTHGAHIVQTTVDLRGDSMPNTRATKLLGWTPQCS